VPSVEELKVYVAGAVEVVERAGASIRGAGDQLDEALALLRLTAAGTAHPSLLDAVAQLEQAKARLDEAQTHVGGAVEAANRYRTLI
jgi:hypothetical protein